MTDPIEIVARAILDDLGEIGDATRARIEPNVRHDSKLAVEALRSAGLLVEWNAIETMPTDDTLFIAATADGRRMIWRGDLLVKAMLDRTPDHLQFPAVAWMPLPKPPEE